MADAPTPPTPPTPPADPTMQAMVSEYTGKGDSKYFVEKQQYSAATHIYNAELLIDAVNDKLVAGMDADLDGGDFSDISFTVAKPSFTKSNVTNITSPEAPDIDTDKDISITMGEVNDGVNVGGDAPLSPQLGNISNTPNIMAPIKPTDTVPENFSFTPSGYTQGLLDFVRDKIREAFAAEDELTQINAESNVALDGNTSAVEIVNTDIERAIYDRAVSRLQDEEAIAVVKAEQTIQSRGFSLPVGALNSQLETIHKASTKAREDLNNDIIKSQIELEQKRTDYELQRATIITDAQYKHDSILVQIHNVNLEYVKSRAQNKAVYIEAAAKLEGVLADIYKTEETLKMDAAKTSFTGAIEVYNAKVTVFKQLMEAYKIENDVSIATINSELQRNKSLVDIYSAEIGAYKVTIDGELSKLEGKKVNADIEKTKVLADVSIAEIENKRWEAVANVYGAQVQAYAARVNAAKSVEMLDVERYQVEAQGAAAEIQANVAKATAEVDSAIKKYSIDMEVLKQQSTLAGNIVSSALNSINTSTSFGFSGGASRSVGYTNTDSLSFSYLGETSDSRP